MSAENGDPEMSVDEEPEPILAADDSYTWAKVADLALRHIARVEEPPRHPDDSMVEAGIRQTVLQPLRMASRLALVSYDAHVPAVVRDIKTPSYIMSDISAFSSQLARRPSDYLIGNADAWLCPHHACMFSIDLSNLSVDACNVLHRATVGAETRFASNAVADAQYLREVVDIVGLAHYQDAHLVEIGVRHVLHGQSDDGRILYHWEAANLKHLLVTHSVRGSQARHHEEKCRVNMQRALAFEARIWATDVIFQTQKEEHSIRAQARKAHSTIVRRENGHLVHLDLARADSLFEARSSKFVGRSPTSKVVRQPMNVLNYVHGVIYNFDDGRFRAAADRQQRRARAEQEQTFWNEGEGWERAKHRGQSLQL